MWECKKRGAAEEKGRENEAREREREREKEKDIKHRQILEREKSLVL